MPGIRPVLLALFAWILAHNILYTYIAPFLVSVGLGKHTDIVLLWFGVSSIAGIWVVGLLVDRCLRLLTLLSLAVFALAALLIGISDGSSTLILIGIAAWGLTFGGDVAQSMLVTVFNLAVAGGGIAGGVLLQRLGPVSLPWALVVLGILALGVVWSARVHGFRPGQRHALA
ncbi:hypothetical protein AO963_29345 [Pseudomonas aeruginosa]|nr:hypothetical protein AO963_29345 [Pseudomonas aeruginosa]